MNSEQGRRGGQNDVRERNLKDFFEVTKNYTKQKDRPIIIVSQAEVKPTVASSSFGQG